jgi:hypothetical protein
VKSLSVVSLGSGLKPHFISYKLKDKRMFALTNAAHSALPISSVSNDFKVHGFKDYEAISSLYAIQIELVIESFDFDLESLLRQPRFVSEPRTHLALVKQVSTDAAVKPRSR